MIRNGSIKYSDIVENQRNFYKINMEVRRNTNIDIIDKREARNSYQASLVVFGHICSKLVFGLSE